MSNGNPSSQLGSSPASANCYVETSEFALWNKYEDVAMHFNDLIMRLRTQALGALTGVVAISGLAMNFTGKPATHLEWQILFGTILFFTFAWASLWVLDLCYYDKLLLGAVEALIEHENSTLQDGAFVPGKSIILSTLIKKKNPNYIIYVKTFYGVVLAGLLIGLGYTGYHSIAEMPQISTDKLELKVDRTHGDKLELKIEPTATGSVNSPSIYAPNQAGATTPTGDNQGKAQK